MFFMDLWNHIFGRVVELCSCSSSAFSSTSDQSYAAEAVWGGYLLFFFGQKKLLSSDV